MRRIPERAAHGGDEWTVSRVWPSEAPGFPVELRAGERLRAAHWDGSGFHFLEENSDPLLPHLRGVVERRDGIVVSHRPGKRAVVRTGDGTYVKIVRSGRSVQILHGMARARMFARSFRTPRILSHDAGAVEFSAVAGRGLHEGCEWGMEEWDAAWSDVLTAWASATSVKVTDLPVHDAEKEAVVLASWVQKASQLPDFDVAGASRAAAQAITELTSLREPAVITSIHRDLHDKQLIWDRTRGPGLIDLDTACCGDPATDLGNLRAHAVLRAMQGLWSSTQSTRVRESVDAVGAERSVPETHTGAHERATLTRLACIYSFRPRWRHLVSQLLEEARRP